ncbi:MAG: Na+-transporting NADH:ubiquinone oxidoreductase subunit [Clostridiales bacterium]|jgi:Na+-transporting NADH:ubiquinone oxidoreductase subunit C|nr:Na+-transporting NADH:ubiquinone oxidoreductase subunit [Clostridiales bacterium]
MAKPKRILYPVFFMVLITAVYTLILASLNAVSAERVAEQESLRLERAILYANAIDAADDTALHQIFVDNFEQVKADDLSYYRYATDGQVTAYTFPFTGKGLWGTVNGYIAISSDFKTILGVDFISHSETPGLGGRIDEAWFKEQFRGIPLETAPYIRYRSEANGNVDAITGATLTSNAIKGMLNTFLETLMSTERAVIVNE